MEVLEPDFTDSIVRRAVYSDVVAVPQLRPMQAMRVSSAHLAYKYDSLHYISIRATSRELVIVVVLSNLMSSQVAVPQRTRRIPRHVHRSDYPPASILAINAPIPMMVQGCIRHGPLGYCSHSERVQQRATDDRVCTRALTTPKNSSTSPISFQSSPLNCVVCYPIQFQA